MTLAGTAFADDLVSVRRTRSGLALRVVGVVLLLLSAVAVVSAQAGAAIETQVGGSVTEADGTPVPGVKADLFTDDGGQRGLYLATAWTDSSGQFAFGTAAGCYIVTVSAPDGRRFDGSAWYQRPVCVEDGQESAVPVGLLDPISDAALGGTVRFQNGAAGSGVVVDLFQRSQQGGRGEYLRSTRTAEDGTYRFLAAADCYIATFIAPDGASFAGARYFQASACLADGQTRTDVDAVLDGSPQGAASLGGRVTFVNGAVAAGVEVTVWETGGDGARTNWVGSAYTADDGRFSAPVAPGCYWLIYVAVDGSRFGDSRYLESFVCVRPGQTLENLDATLERQAGTEIEILERRWAEARADVISRIERGNYGVDNGVLTGPGNFRVDLSQCPANWRNDPAGGGDIIIGNTTPLSGVLAAYGNISIGMQVYLDHVNTTGGIDGKRVRLELRDDQFIADRTIELVDELLRDVDPFAIMTVGTPNGIAVYDTLSAECVPHPFTISGSPAWGDPINHPWTSGLPMSWATEAQLWGTWIETNLADELPVKVAALVADHDVGRTYRSSFQDWVDQHPEVVSSFVAVSHDPAAATVANEMTTVAGLDPDVFISMTAGNPCLLAMVESERSGLAEGTKARFTPSFCRDPLAYMNPAGRAGDGVLVADGAMKRINDPRHANDPYIRFANETLQNADLDTSVNWYGIGFADHGWPLVEALRIAAELDGGLTRANFLLAQRAMTLIHPAVVDGIAFSMNGVEDSYFIEGSTFSRFDADNQSWIVDGPPVDLNGQTPNCAWSQSTGC